MHITSTMITGLTLLAFIEQNQVIDAFKKIKNYIEEKTDDINYKNYLNYFERNWIKGNIPIKTWNFYEEVVNHFGKFKRTNNCVESFHNMLSKRINKVSIII